MPSRTEPAQRNADSARDRTQGDTPLLGAVLKMSAALDIDINIPVFEIINSSSKDIL